MSGPTVHVMVGLPAAGKSTLARQLASELPAVRFGLDDWMIRLHALRFDDEEYAQRLPACRDLILEMAGNVLSVGVDVVLDWNHWSPERRREARIWAGERGAGFVVHYVTTPIEVAERQALAREDELSHRLSADGVHHAQSYFIAPEATEGNTIVVHEHEPEDNSP